MRKATYIKLKEKPDNMTEKDWKIYNQLWEENKDDLWTLGVIENRATFQHPDMEMLKDLIDSY